MFYDWVRLLSLVHLLTTAFSKGLSLHAGTDGRSLVLTLLMLQVIIISFPRFSNIRGSRPDRHGQDRSADWEPVGYSGRSWKFYISKLGRESTFVLLLFDWALRRIFA